MRYAPVNERNFIDTGLDGFHGAVNFGDHSLVDNARFLQFGHFGVLQMGNDGGDIAGVSHEPGHLAHENEAFGAQGDGGFGGADVRVAIIDFPIFSERGGTDDRSDAAPDAFAEWFGVDTGD